jgi:hypothetical protein
LDACGIGYYYSKTIPHAFGYDADFEGDHLLCKQTAITFFFII